MTMNHLGFGAKWQNVVYWLYNHSDASLILSSSLSDSWKLGRSVRQGCPLSALLFAIATHPFLCYLDFLQAIDELHGLQLPTGRTFLAHAYADDSFFMPKNT